MQVSSEEKQSLDKFFPVDNLQKSYTTAVHLPFDVKKMMDSTTERVLLVEDDPQLGTGLTLYLETEGFEADWASTGEKGLEKAEQLPGFDLIVLDAQLPGRSGFDVLRDLRARGVRTPVLMLTGLGSHEDRMRGFELGADDYLTKPFSTDELLARVQAILRRTQRSSSAMGVYEVGGIVVNLEKKEITTTQGDPIVLTDLEYQLLRYLVIHHGRTTTREQILRDVWNLPSDLETRTIDRHINAIRRVMEGEDEETWAIKSVYGIGYKLVGVKQR